MTAERVKTVKKIILAFGVGLLDRKMNRTYVRMVTKIGMTAPFADTRREKG